MPESYSHEELKEKVRTGWQLTPTTPGLKRAAREVIRPLIEGMKGQKIIYRCRTPFLMRIDELTVDDERFRAVATVLRHYSGPEMDRYVAEFMTPFEFRGSWTMLRLCGKAIQMAMVTDGFIVDEAVVAEVEAGAANGESVAAIVCRACEPRAGSK